jgi:hypothetical protein
VPFHLHRHILTGEAAEELIRDPHLGIGSRSQFFLRSRIPHMKPKKDVKRSIYLSMPAEIYKEQLAVQTI